MTDPTKPCPRCGQTIMLEARICRHCGARFALRTVGYCARDHQVTEADAQGRCSLCGGELTDVRVDSAIPEEAQAGFRQEADGGHQPEPLAARARARRGSRLWLRVLPWVLLVPLCLILYAMFYHNGPPIPQLNDFFGNISYELTAPEPVFPDTIRSILPRSVDPDLTDGFYYWELTNTNEFAWPGAFVRYGDDHTFGLERVEPGETVGIWNLQLHNSTTGDIEPVRWEPGESVELTLYIDFSEDTSLPARVRKLLGMGVQWYPLGGWTRQPEGG